MLFMNYVVVCSTNKKQNGGCQTREVDVQAPAVYIGTMRGHPHYFRRLRHGFRRRFSFQSFPSFVVGVVVGIVAVGVGRRVVVADVGLCFQ